MILTPDYRYELDRVVRVIDGDTITTWRVSQLAFIAALQPPVVE